MNNSLKRWLSSKGLFKLNINCNQILAIYICTTALDCVSRMEAIKC